MRMAQGWDREAGNWARFARTPGLDRAHENVNLPVLRELLPAPGARTLDFGCGEGRVSRLLASLGHRVTGIDASPAMVALARGHADPVRPWSRTGRCCPSPTRPSTWSWPTCACTTSTTWPARRPRSAGC